jgi:2-polyprenyl-3-methyl-5-hydroxy-6-metoxy-1,4-benzoquinol methylase
MFKKFKIFSRNVQEFLERNIVGDFIQKLSWKWRHVYDKSWTKISLTSINLDHRKSLVSLITSYTNINSVLEVGCASAPNLRLLREKLPKAKLTGVDINKSAIKTAKSYFLKQNDCNANFFIKSADELNYFSDNSYDVVFSQAVLVFVTPSSIRKAIRHMLRISRSLIVLNEYHLDNAAEGCFDGGRWIYDYRAIVAEYCPEAEIIMKSSGLKGGIWDDYGSIVVIKLNDK